jgi:NAD(P) transhydrogenase subunit alpha
VRLAILTERAPYETRVALLPDAVKALVARGIEVWVEAGAGYLAGATDEAYRQAGAQLTGATITGPDITAANATPGAPPQAVPNRAGILATADILPVVNVPSAQDQQQLKPGALVIGFLRPLEEPQALIPAIERGVTLFATELIPRITRAQAMDALSSMATVAGYKAAVVAAATLPRLFPMLMTAAGTIPPARVFVIGAGVAGLQAIATARRLGAVVEAYDVRAAAGEQIRSLGAKFLAADLEGIETEDQGGYAKELSEAALDRGRDLIARTAAYSDVIISTAQVPGRPAPLLIRRDAVEAMRPGSLILDLAAPSGGNCELTRPGETYIHQGVTLLAPLNLPVTVPVHASQLYSRNISNFLALILKPPAKSESSAPGQPAPDPVPPNAAALTLDFHDEILSSACVAHHGKVTNPRVAAALSASTPVSLSAVTRSS